MFKRFFSLMAVAAAVAPAFAVTWLDNAEAAKKQAKAEHKLILADFTGSDWCGWCIRLRKEVFDTPEFEAYAKDKFVFLEVDMPRNKAQSPELKKQNAELCRRYQVSGFPTVLVLNLKGDAVGGFGGYRDMAGVTAALDDAMKGAKASASANKRPKAGQSADCEAISSDMDTSADTQPAETKVGRALEKCRYLTDARPAQDAKKYIFVQMSDDSALKRAALPTVLAAKLSLQQNGESTMVMLSHVDKKQSGSPYEMTGLPVVAMDEYTKIPGVKRSEEPLTVTIVDEDGKECYEELDALEQTALSPLLNMAGGLPDPAELIPGALGVPSPF